MENLKIIISLKLTLTLPSNKKAITISTSDFANGLYTYKATFENCPSVTGKLIIKH
jgi:hypothetical protein